MKHNQTLTDIMSGISHHFGEILKEREEDSYQFNEDAEPNKMISNFNLRLTFGCNTRDQCGIGFQPSFNPGNGSFGVKAGVRFNF